MDDLHQRATRERSLGSIGSRIIEAPGTLVLPDPLTRMGLPSDDFDAAFRASPVALAVARDSQCRVVVRNAAMNRFIPASLDWQAWRLPDGTMPPVFDVDGAALAPHDEPLRRAAFGGERTVDRLLEWRWPGRAPVFLRVSAEPLFDGAGTLRGAVASAIDVGGERALARRVQRAADERRDAEAADRAKDALIALFGHDARNPLNAIATAVEVLARADPAAPEALSARRILGRQSRRLAQMLTELGEVGRSLAEPIELAPERLALGALVHRCLARAAPKAQARGLRVHSELSDVLVDADAERFAQAVDRLLDDTLCAAPAGAVLTVRLREVGTEAVLEIRELGADEPLPVPGAAIALDPPAGDAHGPGLGLSTMLLRRLVESHGGRLVARRHDPATGGSVSLVRLPSAMSMQADGRPARPGRPEAG